jgi:hypothetical protein
MHRWSASLQKMFHATHLYQVEALAAFSFAAARARHCHLSRLAAHVPLEAQPASELRRLHRFLGNSRLDVQAVCAQMAQWLGAWNRPTCRLTVLLDETPHSNQWRVIKVSVCYRRRALALAWRVDPLTQRSQVQSVHQVLGQAADLVQQYAPQAQVVLLADRGLCWPSIMHFCRQNQWHFVLRAQSSTLFRYFDSTSTSTSSSPESSPERKTPLKQLVTQSRQWFKGEGIAFQKAGWLPVNVVGCWRPGSQEPWFLVTDLRPSLHLMRTYAHRMWHEQSFRDEKSHGFCWDQSRIKTAARMDRLLLILALAQLWLSWLGCCATDPHLPWRQTMG